MKIFLKLILIYLFFCSNTNVFALNNFDLEKMIISQIKTQLFSLGYEDVEVNVINIPVSFDNINSKNIKVKVMKSNNGLQHREFRTVKLICGGKVVKTFGVPIEIKAFKSVLIAKDIIPKGSCVSTSNCYYKKVDVSKCGKNIFANKVTPSDLIALKMFKKDEIIDKRFVKYKSDVSKNDNVIVEFHSRGGLNISIDAISLSDGNLGDVVNVKNTVYKKIYRGIVTGKNRVVVEI